MRGYILAGLAVLTVALALVGGASAYNNHGWYWSPATAENTYYDRNINDNTTAVSCTGYGHHIRAHRAPHRLLYAHFSCTADDGYGDWFSFRMHVTGEYDYAASNVGCIHYADPSAAAADPGNSCT